MSDVGRSAGRSARSLMEQLRWQLAFLRTSIEAYEGGQEFEALRIATTLRVLCHDTLSSHSLLGQLGFKEQGGFVSTLDPPYGFLFIEQPEGYRARYAAPLSADYQRVLSFDEWWSEEVLQAESHGSGYSRQRLVLDVANKEGGAHLDPVQPARLQALSEAVLPGRTSGPNIAVKTLSWEAIRQIAFEFELSAQAAIPVVAKAALGRKSSYPAINVGVQGPITVQEVAPPWQPFYPYEDV